MDIQQLYDIYTQYPHITTDTRKCIPNSIFFSLKGANFNGNEYAAIAIDNGCKIALVDEKPYVDAAKGIFYVEDCLITLQELARYHRDQFKIPVIAITGTNGKTTTKELITSVLSQKFNVLSTEGNLNNHIGVPLTLLQLNKSHEVAIIEMGANHVGEIKILAEIANPNYGLITNVGRAHIEGFGSFENIIKTKGELYDYIRKQTEAKVFVDFDNTYLLEMSKGMNVIYYGKEDNLFVSGRIEANNPYLVVLCKLTESYHRIHTNLIGDYNISNILASVTIGKYFGIKPDKVIAAIENYKPVNLRSQLKDTERNTLIIDAYNANPTSMSAAVKNMVQLETNLGKVLILGDMKELGAEAANEHQKIVDIASENNLKEVYLVGDNFHKTDSAYEKFETLDSFIEFLKNNQMSNKFILIKGSRGLQLEKCIDLL